MRSIRPGLFFALLLAVGPGLLAGACTEDTPPGNADDLATASGDQARPGGDIAAAHEGGLPPDIAAAHEGGLPPDIAAAFDLDAAVPDAAMADGTAATRDSAAGPDSAVCGLAGGAAARATPA